MKLPCAVVRDLLPLYAEKMTEEETRKMVEEHLEGCAECRERLAGIDTGTEAPADTAKPLMALKKEIKKRRWYAVLIAALCVFIGLYTWFYHANAWEQVPWEEGLIQVTGIEERPYEEIYGDGSEELRGTGVKVLILQAEARINGFHESAFTEEDGTETVVLQGWTNNPMRSGSAVREYSEMVFPMTETGRLIYDGGETQTLLWGEAASGGVEILPRLALSYYAMIAAGAGIVSGIVWFAVRGREKSWIARQIFFGPAAYCAAHLLIKGFSAASDFLGHDLGSILLLTAAIYALLTLGWQVIKQRT